MLIDALIQTVRRQPKQLAVRDHTRSLTYAQFSRFARVMRRLVQKATTCPRVGVMLPGSAGGLGTIIGTLWAGRTVVPLNFLLQQDELIEVIKDAQIDVIITTEHFEKLCAPLPVRCIYLERSNLARRYMLESIRRCPPPPAVKGGDLAAIVYTSGTSGQPKGVCLSHDNFLSNAQAAIEHLRITPDNHLLGLLPPFHVFGLTVMTFVPIILGVPCTFIPRFSAQATYQAIAGGDITIMMAIPSMFAAIARLKELDRSAFSRLKIAASGGEPLPRGVYDEFFQRTGQRIIEGYGLTETSPIISVDLPWNHRPGTVGPPLPGIEVQVRDDEGRPLPEGSTGELYVRGPSVMQGYYRRPRETAEVIDDHGWFRTGDLVRLDADNYITITGRAKDLIIVGGENVYPREVEEVLEEHSAVAEAAVVGRPDELRGEVAIAYVVLADGEEVTADQLREFCRAHLAGFKVPRKIHICRDLPRGPTGKILKRQLR